ncbi:hypothetical protein GCK32_003089 [Trichostrongylus colubriformis]|uniref:glucuronosyltransferase n=1 Tax=Trichostrongylus colubriformis TaxID=6319 RepID=A0AAN8IQL8_TRICO
MNKVFLLQTVLHPVVNADHVHEVSKKSKRLLVDMPESLSKKFDIREVGVWNLASKSFMDQLKMVVFASKLQQESCEYLVGDNRTMNLLRDEHFDVGISELFALCGFGLFELINIPHIIGASAFGVLDSMNEFVEVPVMPSFMPAIILYAKTVTSAKLIESVHSILEDDKYRRRAERLSSLITRKPFRLKERLLSTVEFSAMHGKIEELNVYSYRMGVIQYFCLDELMQSLLILNVLFDIAFTLKILIYSAPLGFSHIQFMGTIADILHDAGHDVTVLHPVIEAGFVHAVSKKAKRLLVDMPETLSKKFDKKEMGLWNLASKSIMGRLEMAIFFSNLQQESCEYLVGDNKTMSLLRDEHFDVGISEVFALCGFGLFELINIPHMIGASAVGVVDSMNEFVEVPIMPSFMPYTFISANFIKSVQSILEDERYRHSAQRLSSLMNRKPFKLKERLLSTVEFSAMHGKIAELNVYSYRMGAIQYFCLDVILVAFSLVALSFYAVAYNSAPSRCLCRSCTRSFEEVKTGRMLSLFRLRPHDLRELMRFLLILNVLFDIAFTLKILIYSAPLGLSHMRFMGTIADILHDAGHDVTVLHPVVYADLVHEVSKMSKRLLVDMPEFVSKKFDIKEMGLWNLASKSIMGRLEMAIFFSNLQRESCEYLVGSNKTISLLRDEHFDVGISEVITPCGFGLFELINIPHMIGASNTGVIDSMNEFVDVPIMPSFMPAVVLYTESFTSANFVESVHSILEDSKYRRRAERLSSLMNSKPFKLKERLLSTVEFSAMHGKIEELDVYSYRMGAIQYFCLDTVLHPVWEQQHPSAVSKLAKKVLFPLPAELSEDLYPQNLWLWESRSSSIVDTLKLLSAHTELQLRTCDLLLGDNGTMQMLANKHFDAGITEMLGLCGFAIFSKIGIGHMIGASAWGLVDSVGEYYQVPKFPSIVPSFLLPYNDRMNFVQRTINFIAVAIADLVAFEIRRKYMVNTFIPSELNLFNHHGVVSIEEYYEKRVNYLLSNSDEFLEFQRPLSPKIIHIGGITLHGNAPLSEKLQQILEQSKKGVVYISFGSSTSTRKMPKHIREAIIETVRAYENYDFIWKIDEDDIITSVKNLHTFSWVSQPALIAHPNLRCFVSHAGTNSVLELTTIGKPSILVPIFGDQFRFEPSLKRNAKLVEAKNTTIVIAKEEFTRDTFAAALQRVLSDNSFSKRAQRLASLMVNKPFPIRDRLLSVVNFTIQHGRIYDLDIYSKELTTMQYHSVDVVAFLVTCFLSIATAWFYVCRCLCRKMPRLKIKKL